jgi:peptide/nickel transport system permease protein
MTRWSLSFWVGSSLVGFIVLMALSAPLLPVPAPAAQDLFNEFAAPSSQHWFGQGENGVDVFANVAWGSRLSLLVGVGSVLISSFVGLMLGSIAGFLRGAWDAVLMRIVDLLYSFPGLLLVVALAALLGPSLKNMMIAMILTGWAGYARLARLPVHISPSRSSSRLPTQRAVLGSWSMPTMDRLSPTRLAPARDPCVAFF